jgi:hypothetical protein
LGFFSKNVKSHLTFIRNFHFFNVLCSGLSGFVSDCGFATLQKMNQKEKVYLLFGDVKWSVGVSGPVI